ncbi:flagellar motor switch phosphatase FliY [Bacillus sp. MUM 13]|uniref:flagellar motor switch phosphatase FliY n=1 Tax=Bacillus sp. MUM 13 TaxID=1678001 RepID=UPI0008F5A8D9|nr:flagellar motor switch phosphatase FliY [Bacillus sp. MUM 13]OIK15291.1 flagellar motor switch phosphatase FliY [Bacillus sp. MUM 13]
MVSDEMLSQDEIDALLRGTDDISETAAPNVEDFLTSMEQDALGEVGNISFGSSATALSTLLNQKVEITTPSVTLIERNRISEEFPQPYVAIQVNYTEGFSGVNLLVIKQSDAAIIADLMLGGNGIEPADLLGEIQLSAVQEAFNQMMGSAATSMSTIFSKKVDISPPTIDILNIEEGKGEETIPQEDYLAKISFRLKVGELIDSSIMQLLPLHFAKSLVDQLLNPQSDEAFVSNGSPAGHEQNHAKETQQAPSVSSHTEAVDESRISNEHQQSYNGNDHAYGGYTQQHTQASAPVHQNPGTPQHLGSSYQDTNQKVNVQPASFSEFQPYPLQETETKNLNMLLDIPLQVTVELGRTNRSVKEILELSSGSIIELDKLAGEPVDILVNSRLIAKGEVVVIDENFGVRVTDIVSQSDRLKKLR